MKQILIFTLIFMILGCIKDEIDQPNTKGHKYFSIDDYKGTRDGGQQPFHFMTDQVEYDPFKAGYPQTAINIQRLDSVKYFRTSQPNAGAWGTTFDIYNITYYFKDGTTKQSSRIYAESVIGASHTHYPDNAYNQLSVNNPSNYVTLKRSAKAETYADNGCGKIKKRFNYTHYFNTDSVGVNTIDGDRCASNVFSYQLITIQ